MLLDDETVEVTRDVRAIIVPDGTLMTLEKGAKVWVEQSLGGTYTLRTDYGFRVRIEGEDADAIGREPEVGPGAHAPTDAASTERAVWDVLRTVYDPEIPVDIVELGLIYECRLEPAAPREVQEPSAESGESEPCDAAATNGTALHDAFIRMTLTAPGCGMGPVLQRDVETKVRRLPGIRDVTVEVALDPPWTPEKMTEAARLQLGMF